MEIKLFIVLSLIVVLILILNRRSIINKRITTKFSLPTSFAEADANLSLVLTDGQGNLINTNFLELTPNNWTEAMANDKTKSYITSDNSTYKGLMLAGNNSSGERTVKVYDNLEVNGNIRIGNWSIVKGEFDQLHFVHNNGNRIRFANNAGIARNNNWI